MPDISKYDGWIGRQMGNLRRERGKTLDWMAGQIGADVARLERIEAGHEGPVSAELIKAAQALDCPIEAFFPPAEIEIGAPYEVETRLKDVQPLLKVLAGRGRLDEAYTMLWKLALA